MFCILEKNVYLCVNKRGLRSCTHRATQSKINKTMKNEIYLKAGRVELSREEVQEFVNAKRVYIVAYRDIYFIDWSNNAGRYYARKIYTKYGDLPLTKRGRFYVYPAKWVNDLLDFQLLAE